MSDVIVDSNIIVGLVDAKDKWNAKAKKIREELKRKNFTLIYFDIVYLEALSTLGRRLIEQKRIGEYRNVVKKFQELIPLAQLTWVSSDIQTYFKEILTIMDEYSGRLNSNDAFIALIAKKLKIKYIASFDKSFDEINWLERID